MPPVPVYVKGGAWSNLEDQILTAAVQKYGPHQWSKIASLLQKKSARQCDIRWNEYLKPSLNLSEFSRAEDRMLLDLARRLPNQWRTIAEKLGRTAQSSIERYNALMAEPQDLGPEGALNRVQATPLDFKVGDLNPVADTQAAIPDKDDLDDDERAMLAEAKARLLSTQGKKATRKVKERLLEESKQIAKLQHDRELKQAGRAAKIKQGKKKRYATEIDYNADIPYQQNPLPGIYDIREETERTLRELAKFESNVDKRGLKEKASYKESPDRAAKPRKDTKGTDDAKPPLSTSELKPTLPPTLVLSPPGGHKGNGPGDEQSITLYRQQIIQNQSLGSVLNKSDDVAAGDTTTVPFAVELDTRRKHDEFATMVRKRQIAQLFEMLPPPLNDFEIELESDDSGEEQESEDDDGNNNTSDERRQEVTAPLTTRAILALPCLLHEGLPAPPAIERPLNEYDRTYNELLLTSLEQNDYEVDTKLLAYFDTVEQRIRSLNGSSNPEEHQQRLLGPLHTTTATTREQLVSSIRAKQKNIAELQAELNYVTPLIQQNKALSQQLCGDLLPHWRKLRQEYSVQYRLYMQETRGRKKPRTN
ncbi:Cef1p KNAG_0J02010 [Huiozyma naganishii CBS 8797]|uniref:Pre-mRNA-splicing factor CEF1 n=1 Tax=Huiozyma naganishii (strain ATCC MYA-139 / BCRC 22969 / CBS 8797 / KCTC 17520 / NBRC 10181 / NCYC 3082 / Yp74L-3) TaxID=1071383 RepID=J7S2W8_HUIN7|nr:hypothetical protein KNAG_0J02010 [Kazachstania naganishii CBS 8797]CCK72282.1 hypothetical protein KNAG_0J02010 [Kazachstania naganishii CBS 8797]